MRSRNLALNDGTFSDCFNGVQFFHWDDAVDDLADSKAQCLENGNQVWPQLLKTFSSLMSQSKIMILFMLQLGNFLGEMMSQTWALLMMEMKSVCVLKLFMEEPDGLQMTRQDF